MRPPKPIQRAIEAFERLPGIGPKTAARLTYHLLPFPESKLREFADALIGLKRDLRICSICYNFGETDPCAICGDNIRDRSLICVVEHPLDLVAIENTNQYHGLYHVLHGVIDPLHHIGPDDIYLGQLISRIRNSVSSPRPVEGEGIKEVILALNPTMEGEATSIYIKNQISKIKDQQNNKSNNQDNNLAIKQFNNIKITRLAQGLSLGSDLEYADAVTLTRALQGRGEI
jgi:recombination protein RecR